MVIEIFLLLLLSVTVIATWIGGDSLSVYLSETYIKGPIFMLMGCSSGISFLIIAYVFAPRFTEFLGKLSIADAMYSLFGNHVRIITVILSLMSMIIIISIQFKVLAEILGSFVNLPKDKIMFLSVAIITAYSSIGGVRSVTFTDIIQFLTFGIVLPILALVVIWMSVGDSNKIIEVFANKSFTESIRSFSNQEDSLWSMFSFIILFIIPRLGAETFQRLSMARNTQK